MNDGQEPFGERGRSLFQLPRWVTAARAEPLEDVAFLSGAVLACLETAVQHPNTPDALLRAHLALAAAEGAMQIAGRVERAGDLRDEVLLLRPGDQPGPAGAVYQSWQRAVARPVSSKALIRALPKLNPMQAALWLEAGQGGAITRAAQVIEAVLTDTPRADTTALIMADATLAHALGWDHLLPCLALGLTRADLRKRGDDLRLACHHAVIRAVRTILPMAQNLTRRAAHLRAITPKLRAKAAGQAVQMFLMHEAVAPTALPLPDRSARRLCDRLVALGAVRELTGRDVFRLYGVAP